MPDITPSEWLARITADRKAAMEPAQLPETEALPTADRAAPLIHLHHRYTGEWTVCGNDEVPFSETTERLNEATCPRCVYEGDPVPRTRALTIDRAHAEAVLTTDDLGDLETIDAIRTDDGDVTLTMNTEQAAELCDLLDNPDLTGSSSIQDDLIARMQVALRKVYPY
jgi:hypothetical protein